MCVLDLLNACNCLFSPSASLLFLLLSVAHKVHPPRPMVQVSGATTVPTNNGTAQRQQFFCPSLPPLCCCCCSP